MSIVAACNLAPVSKLEILICYIIKESWYICFNIYINTLHALGARVFFLLLFVHFNSWSRGPFINTEINIIH